MSFLSSMRQRRAAYYYKEATRLAGLGSVSKAVEALDRVIELAPGQAEAYYQRGIQLARLGRDDAALADFDQVRALKPGQTDAEFQRSLHLSRLGRHDEALAAVDEFLRHFPGSPNGLIQRGTELQALGRPDDALAAYDEILASEPENPVAHHNRAVTLTGLGRHDEALAAYDQAVAAAPGQIYFRIAKGKALAAAGELGRAREELEAAARLRPEEAGEAQAWIAAIAWHQGDEQAARERFGQVKGHLASGPAAKNAMLEATALLALGDPGAAERALGRGGPGTAAGEDFERLWELLSDPPLPGIDRLRSAGG